MVLYSFIFKVTFCIFLLSNYLAIVVQSFSCVWLFLTPWQASLAFTISWNMLKLMSTELVMPSKHVILCHPLLLLSSIFPSIRVFFNKSILCIRWPKYWSLSFSISSSAVNFLYSPALTSIMTTENTIAFTRQTSVGKVMSLLFNMLSRLVIAFLPRSKRLLISWLQSPSSVILEPTKIHHNFHCFPTYWPWSDGAGCHDLCFLNVEI